MPRKGKQNKEKFIGSDDFQEPKSTTTRRSKRPIKPSDAKLNEIQAIQNIAPDELSVDQVRNVLNPFASKNALSTEKVTPIQRKQLKDTTPQQVLPSRMKRIYSRPYFSPEFNSYEADLGFFENRPKQQLNYYLFLININTRYLYFVPIPDKKEETLLNALKSLIGRGLRISNLRSDGEPGLNSELLTDFYKAERIKFYSSPSPYVQKNRIVDRCIRTLRDMYDKAFPYQPKNAMEEDLLLSIDVRRGDYGCSATEHLHRMQHLIAIYNNTYHREIKMSPNQMQSSYQLELDYIIRKKAELEAALKTQTEDGLRTFKRGDILAIFRDPGKTNARHEHGKRNYNQKVRFIEYIGGNVKGEYYEKDKEGKLVQRKVTVPIYHAIKYNADGTTIGIPKKRKPEQKRGRGRPPGSKDSYDRTRRTKKEIEEARSNTSKLYQG